MKKLLLAIAAIGVTLGMGVAPTASAATMSQNGTEALYVCEKRITNNGHNLEGRCTSGAPSTYFRYDKVTICITTCNTVISGYAPQNNVWYTLYTTSGYIVSVENIYFFCFC